MMKVFKCISTFADTVSGTGKGKKWKSRTDANFSVEEIDQWKRDYGGIEMEFSNDFAGGADEEVDLGPVKPDPVVKADPADFIVSETVTPQSLRVTLDALLEAVDELDRFERHETPAETAEACTDASLKAAKYAAQLKAAAAQADDSAQRKRLLKAYDDVEQANQAMVDAQNAYQDAPDDKAARAALHAACDEMRRAAKQAQAVAERRPAKLASEADYASSRKVTPADIDVSLSELVKAVKKAKAKGDKPPLQTTTETEDASKKAARFAAQVRQLGKQRAADGDAAGEEYLKRMNARADAINAANKELIDANNAYVLNPADSKLVRRHDDACDQLISVAEEAGQDARAVPPAPLKRASPDDFTIGGTVTGADLDASLNDVLKAVKKVETFPDVTPAKTAGYSETAVKRTAYLQAQLIAVEGQVSDAKAAQKVARAQAELADANRELANAADAYGGNARDGKAQSRLQSACVDVKQRAAAAVGAAKEAIASDRDAAARAKAEAEARARAKAEAEAARKRAEAEAARKAAEAAKLAEAELQNVGNADIDAESTPLHFATLKGDMSAVRDLINKGMKVDAMNAQGWTPLYTAAWVGNIDLIRFFVKQGADVNVKNDEGWTPIFAGVAQGHKDVVKALALEYNAQVNVQSNPGTTPLYHAAEGGRYSICKTLLEAGADTELGAPDGWKPIHGSVYNYHAKVTALLIGKGAHLNVHNKELKNYTPLHISISTKRPNLEIVEMLCKKADVNAKNKNSATPLHLAAMWGHEAVVDMLVKSGANLKAQNNKRRTPLEVAVRSKHSTIAQKLADKMGVAVPKLKAKVTAISSIAKPEAPPPPPDQK